MQEDISIHFYSEYILYIYIYLKYVLLKEQPRG